MLQSQGRVGEDYAVGLLRNNGYKILQRNFRSRFGEIDIVAQEGDTLIFVEVKTRWSKKFGAPQEAVGERKLNKIKMTANYFALTHPSLPSKMRIDVVAVEIENGKVASAKVIKVY